MKLTIIHKSVLLGLVFLSACSQANIRQAFYQGRNCAEIKYQCLNQTDKSINTQIEPKLAEIYREINLMLDVYYPDFWNGVNNEKVKLDWVQKVHQKAQKYGGENISRSVMEQMANICAIVGVDFDTNPKFNFIVNKIKYNADLETALANIYDYLRFEVLQKDYNEVGEYYDKVSLKPAQENMPPITRPIPNPGFHQDEKSYNHNEDVRTKYNQLLDQEKNK